MRYNTFQEAAEAAKALARAQGRNVSLRREGDQFVVDEDQSTRTSPPRGDNPDWSTDDTGRVDPKDRIPF